MNWQQWVVWAIFAVVVVVVWRWVWRTFFAARAIVKVVTSAIAVSAAASGMKNTKNAIDNGRSAGDSARLFGG